MESFISFPVSSKILLGACNTKINVQLFHTYEAISMKCFMVQITILWHNRGDGNTFTLIFMTRFGAIAEGCLSIKNPHNPLTWAVRAIRMCASTLFL